VLRVVLKEAERDGRKEETQNSSIGNEIKESVDGSI
jgi:hypothetical protein